MRFYINKEHLVNEIEYPIRYQSENLVKSAFVVFAVLFMFLLLFTPFGVYEPEFRMNYFLICFFHAFSPALILFVYFGIFNYIKQKNNRFNKWSLLREYAHVGAVLLLCGIASFLMRDLIYNNKLNWLLHYLYEEIRNCFVAGIFFYFLLRLTGFYFQSKKGSPFVLQFVPLANEPEKTILKSTLFINTQVRQDDFTLDLEHLLFVKADGNYIELTKSENEEVNVELKRISLTQFEKQITAYPHFFRCHRAYLVNMFKIQKVAGNSQGYLLSFYNTDLKVPVSRNQIESFNSFYNQLRNRQIA
ncbi:LytTr DNA-binding domain-containing protein [Flavobacterium chryseum]|uniref:LytTR family DNA-binding domain-containing protein n=1 Tax=Flavobacterium sp. P3160 TaxID=2512113 RepID=UPI00105C8842|nr:LytTR family DNA-binding domain-containing protein [Flavobacterium sp. P3160]TDO82987.1 LytTr DNA-binding domain-containing protein [Flavobacterium sp. P3160]